MSDHTIPSAMFEQLWDMAQTETEKVVCILRAVQCRRLGYWDGCCCSNFNVRYVNVDISCGKGREQAVWVSSTSRDFGKEELKPVMAEVIKQVSEQSGRAGKFTEYYCEYNNPVGAVK